MKNIKVSKDLRAVIIRIVLLIMFILILGKICYGQHYYQSYHQTVYTNIGGTTYVTSINGYGSKSYVTTYEVTPEYSESALKAKEELNRKIDQLNNEMKMMDKWEYGEITYEEYCAAVPQEFRSAKKGNAAWDLGETMHRLNVRRLAEGKDIIKHFPCAGDEGYWEFEYFSREITKELEEAGINHEALMRAQYINEEKLRAKLLDGTITQEEYDAAMKAKKMMEENQD